MAFSVDVVRTPQGSRAVLTDVRTSLVDGEDEPAEKLLAIAEMLSKSVDGMRATANSLKAQPVGGRS